MTYASRVVCRRAAPLLLAAVLSVFFALDAHAQTDGNLSSDQDDLGNGGRNMIQGRLFLPSGRQPERRFRIRLSSVRGEASTTTDDSGSFTFRRLMGGTYRVTVDTGKDFEPVTESVDIFDMGRRGAGQTFILQIKLEAKRVEPAHPAGVIDASLAGIPKEALALYESALQTAKTGDRKQAVEHLKKAVQLHPAFSLAHNELGVQYMALGQPERAAETLREALRLTPEVAMLHLNYGLVLIQLKKFPQAEAALRDALRRDGTLALAHLYLGRVLIKLSRLDEAETELREALRAGGDALAVAHRYLGALYIERGESERAVEALETYLRLTPNAGDAAQIREIINQQRAPHAPSQK